MGRLPEGWWAGPVCAGLCDGFLPRKRELGFGWYLTHQRKWVSWSEITRRPSFAPHMTEAVEEGSSQRLKTKKGWNSWAESREEALREGPGDLMVPICRPSSKPGGEWTSGSGGNWQSFVCKQEKLALAILINEGYMRPMTEACKSAAGWPSLGYGKISQQKPPLTHRHTLGWYRLNTSRILNSILASKFLRLKSLRHLHFSNSCVNLTFWCLSWPSEFKTLDWLRKPSWLSFSINGVLQMRPSDPQISPPVNLLRTSLGAKIEEVTKQK